MSTLADYITATRDLLHDPNANYWSDTQLTRWINMGMQRRDVDTAGNRQQFSKVLTAGTDSYTFTTLGSASIYDLIGGNLIFGGQRLVMMQLSFTELNVKYRQYSPSFQSYPVAFAVAGRTVYLAPSPGSAYTSEWDALVRSTALVATTDADGLPYPYTECPPYYAAWMAKVNERQMDEAEDFLGHYTEWANICSGQRVGLLPNAYGGR